MAKFKGANYRTLKRYAILRRDGSFAIEFKFVSLEGREPQYDLRLWALRKKRLIYTPCGVQLTRDEIMRLRDVLNSMDELNDTPNDSEARTNHGNFPFEA